MVTLEEDLAACEREARNMDPETAEVRWCYDPNPTSPEQEFDRLYFVRRPGSDQWVWLGELRSETQKRLGDRMASGELQAKQFVRDRILEAIRDEPLDDQLDGLAQAIFQVIGDQPLPPEQRASRLRRVAEFLIERARRIGPAGSRAAPEVDIDTA